MLTRAGVDTDPAKKKNDETVLESYKKQIKKLDAAILEIKLDLKWRKEEMVRNLNLQLI